MTRAPVILPRCRPISVNIFLTRLTRSRDEDAEQTLEHGRKKAGRHVAACLKFRWPPSCAGYARALFLRQALKVGVSEDRAVGADVLMADVAAPAFADAAFHPVF